MPEIDQKKYEIGPQGEENISDQVFQDCFIALTLSMLQQSLLSSDHKFFIIQGMYENLKEKGYNEKQMEWIENAMKKIVSRFNIKNDFVG